MESACPFLNKHKEAMASCKEAASKILANFPTEIDEDTLAIIKETAPVVASNIETITLKFYPHMFETHPETKNYFNPAHQIKSGSDGSKAAQPFALAHAILRYVRHLNNPENLKKSLELAAQKHCALQVHAEHYPIVYESFMWAIGQVLGDAVTPPIAEAWSKVVQYIARAFIERELELYQEKQEKEFGWFGWKDFCLLEKRRNAHNIYTFHFAPVDGSQLPVFEAGQYLTLKLDDIPGAHAKTTLRSYSIASPPGGRTFEISVLLEEGNPGGLVSNYLRNSIHPGSIVPIGMPCGTFKVPEDGAPVVLIAGGIGCTVTVSMLSHLVKKKDRASMVYFVQGLRDGSTHLYRNRVSRLLHENKDKMRYLRAYSQPHKSDKEGIDYDVAGRVSIPMLQNFIGDDLLGANYVVCGREDMVKGIIQGLLDVGVPRKAVQFECFGPLATSLESLVEL